MAEPHEVYTAGALHGAQQSFCEQRWQCQAERMLGSLTRFGFGKSPWCLTGRAGGQAQAELDPGLTVGSGALVFVGRWFPQDFFFDSCRQTRKNSGQGRRSLGKKIK